MAKGRQKTANNAGVIAVGALISPLRNYWFLGVGATSTISGIFLDREGNKCGESFTATINHGTGTTPVALSFAELYGHKEGVPLPAVGFAGIISVAVHVDIWADDKPDPDFTKNYARYPQKAATNLLLLGEVA